MAADGIDGGLEAGEAIDGGAPVGEVLVGMDEEGERVLDLAEAAGGLHHRTQRNLAGEVAGRGNDQREDHRRLVIDRGDGGELLGFAHDLIPVVDQCGEAGAQADDFLGLATVERDAFNVFAHAGQGKTEIRLDLLFAKTQAGERFADQVGEPGAEDRINHRDPHHVAGDLDAHDFQDA